MSTESRFSVTSADGQRPNGSVAHAAVAPASRSGQTIRNNADSGRQCENACSRSAVVTPDRQAVEKGRPALSPAQAPWKPPKRHLRRVFRAGAGLFGMLILLLIFAKWVLIPLVLPMSNDAWSNAPLIVVRAENEGNAQVLPEVGQTVEQGAMVAVLSNAGIDPSRIAGLRAELAKSEAEQTKRRSDLQIARDLEQRTNRELEQYRNRLVATLRASLQEAEAKIQERTVAHQRARRELATARSLVSSGAIPRAEFHRTCEAEAMARSLLEQTAACRQGIVKEIEAAEHNVFVQRDTPIYLLRHLQVRQSIPLLEAQLAEIEKQLAATAAALAQVEAHTHRLAGSTVYSPLSGVVRRRNASWGPVAKGEALLEIAPTRGQFIEALFPESRARSLYAGARAVILFTGLPPFEGTLRAVRQPSPTDHDLASAIQLPRRLNQLEVLIDFDNPPSDAALLGRQCQVLVADRSSPGHAWAAKLFCLLRW